LLHCIGLNHKTASIEIRERLTFGPDIIVGALRSLLKLTEIQEAVIISTCNRTEILCVSSNDVSKSQIEQKILHWACQFHHLEAAQLHAVLYYHTDQAMVSHLLAVASGLDSLVLGEPQILGQVKSAYKIAREAKYTGKLLDRLFQQTFNVAKQVRTDTAIGHSAISVAYAAVNLARQIFTDLNQLTALLIGAGETIELVARHLKQHHIGTLIIANRTVERAHKLANEVDATAISLPEISEHLAQADIVISSTASPLPILGKGAVESALKKRKHKPIFMVDIAVPRDIEAEVESLDDIYLYTVDNLKEIIVEGQKSRLEAAQEAKKIIQKQSLIFWDWVRSLDAVDLIIDYRQNAEQIRDQVLNQALKKLDNQSPEAALQYLAHTLTNKLLHTPSAQLREASSTGDKEILAAAKHLLQIKTLN